jgi:hypothetical protein
MRQLKIASSLVICLAAGCASYPKPVESLAASEASIRAAQEFNVQQVPSAALQYQLAREELERAQALMKNDDNEKADGMLLRARADAELAISLTKESKAQADAQAAAQQLKERMAKMHPTQ